MLSLFKKIFSLFKKIPTTTYKFLFAIAFALMISNYKFDLIESFLFDLRTQIKASLGLSKIKDPKIVLIYTTVETIEKYNGFPSLQQQKQLLEKLAQIKNKQILYTYRIKDGNFVEIDGSNEDKIAFANVANSIGSLYFVTNEMALKGQENTLKLKGVFDTLNVASGPRTNDQQMNSKNSISRRMVIDYEGQELIHQKIASLFNPEIIDRKKIHGIYDYIGTSQVYVTFHPHGSFKSYRFDDILEDRVNLSELENKIILVGTDTKKYIEDYVATPYSPDTPDLFPITELHANMLQTLIDNNAPMRLPNYVNWIVTAIIAVLTVYVALSIKPFLGITILISTFFGLILISTILLSFFNIWLYLAHPLLTIFLCYYFFIPYRLIIENRRSWEYIQKNKLLHEVEELKTNFISMMSHDLKTPIARIQGMTEVILQDQVPLSSIQREAVDTIKGSSDDLLKFINAILQYGRIESQGVHLHKQSKDINQLLQEVIKKHEFLAKVKKIKITSEFEPMFPIQVDVELMKQVFSNLIENAIKYSSEESTVTIKSREEGSNVVVEIFDTGMGIPIEDLPNIFMKFYRSHNVKTSTIKGSGLGLYLAQYFTQLHNGEITVTSEPEQGSVFKVTLPS